MLAHVDHGVSAEGVAQPEIGAEIVMAGRHIGIVVDGDWVLAESARRLHKDDDVVGLDCGDDDLAVRVMAAVDEQLTWRLAPVLHHGVAKFLRQGCEPLAIAGRRNPDRAGGHLCVGEPVRVQSPAFDQRVHQRVTVAAGQARHLADAIAVVPQSIQQCDRARRRVQTHGIADPGVFGRIRRKHQRDTLIRGADTAQSGVVERQTGDSGAPFRIGHIGDQTLGVDFLERERNRDDAPVELRDGDLGGHIAGTHAAVVCHPLCA